MLVMPWQDKTSVSFIGNTGLMKTHDEETRRFFEGTDMRCFLCPRNADASLTMVQHVKILGMIGVVGSTQANAQMMH
uniref:Uncharacterized protein n=1 Tax=Oryza brachyantha TaxID=4533 RepID=J3LWH7_ORYBR